MVNFLKKLRIAQLQKGKFLSYATYAVGEIVLVIVGILLALQINSYYQKKSNNERFHIILENVQKELELDINNCNLVIKDYAKKDSLLMYNYFLNASIDSLKKYGKHDFYPHLNIHSFRINKSSFNALLQHQEIIPTANIDLVFSLSTQYTNTYAESQILSELLTKSVYETRKEYIDLINIMDPDKSFDFIVNNPKYKNDILNYSGYGKNYLKIIKQYRLQAEKNYAKIDSILNTSNAKDFKFSNEWKDQYFGTYINPIDSTSIELGQVDQKIVLKNNSSFYFGFDQDMELKKINDSTLFYHGELEFFSLISIKSKEASQFLTLQRGLGKLELIKPEN